MKYNVIRQEELQQNPLSEQSQELLKIMDELSDHTEKLRKEMGVEIRNIKGDTSPSTATPLIAKSSTFRNQG